MATGSEARAGSARGAIDKMLDEVAAEVGLDDYGHPSLRDGLERIWASATTQAELSPLGLAALDGQIRGSLRNRLLVTDRHARHPEPGTTPVAEPLFVVGLPRTGTTALSQLLACDPANRAMRGWEASQSVPPPTREGYDTEPRFEAARESVGLAAVNPGFKAIHHDPPDQPVECAVVLAQHFVSVSLSMCFNVPDYDEWLLAADARPAYAYHRQVLQVLQSEYVGRWHLKSPVHCCFVDVLWETYPDARFVVTHRDPVKVVASVLSLVESLSGTFSDADHHDYIADHWPLLVAEMCTRLLDFRDRHPDTPFHDMPYDQLVRDPVGAVRDMYRSFGRQLSSVAAEAMEAQARVHPPGEFGAHRYRLADFGLARADVEPRSPGTSSGSTFHGRKREGKARLRDHHR